VLNQFSDTQDPAGKWRPYETEAMLKVSWYFSLP